MAAVKITFIISTLSSGGAERVASILCNYWHRDGHKVNIVTFENDLEKPHYPIDKEINVHRLNLIKKSSNLFAFLYNNITRIFIIRKKIKNLSPDIIISFMPETNIISIIAAFKTNIPIVISERVHPAYNEIGSVRSLARKFFYKYAKKVVVQTADIANWINENCKTKSVVIPNPVEISAIKVFKNKNSFINKSFSKKKTIVSIGRLDHQKGFDLLISSFSQVYQKHPNWILIIFGEGSEREKLEHLIRKNTLKKKILLLGVTKNIISELKSCDLYIHPSRYEGFPNALVEALACKKPVIASDCPGATKEILDNGNNGFLFPTNDKDSLAKCMDKLMSEKELRKKFISKGFNSIKEFDAPLIAKKWSDLFYSICSKSKKN